MARVEDMLQKMMRWLDASNEHAKELRGDLSNIGQKVDAHAVSIKHFDLQMAQLSTIVNQRQSITLYINTIQNPKNDGHCMAVSTRGGNKTIDPPMASVVEDEMRKYEKGVETNGEFEESSLLLVDLFEEVMAFDFEDLVVFSLCLTCP